MLTDTPSGSALRAARFHFNVGIVDGNLASEFYLRYLICSNEYPFSRDLTIPHLDLSHFALCIMGN